MVANNRFAPGWDCIVTHIPAALRHYILRKVRDVS
jgi:hypothetical protein